MKFAQRPKERNRKMECKESNRNKEKYVHYMVKHSCGLVRDLLSVLSESNFTVNAQPPTPSNWFGNETEPLIPNSNESVLKPYLFFYSLCCSSSNEQMRTIKRYRDVYLNKGALKFASKLDANISIWIPFDDKWLVVG